MRIIIKYYSNSISSICEILSVSKTTLYRY
ncbi:MAG: helix-turn-helix domain-containing protein [Planctomycetia bacterium]|nr:helix-turn-helix domain-containing protein [Planctomycetia bacterium]